jgi:hypothetical protein
VLDQQRRDRLAGIGLGILGVVVLTMAIFALRDRGGGSPASRDAAPPARQTSSAVSLGVEPSHTSRTHPSSAPPSSTAPSSSAPAHVAKVPLVVENNTSTTGLAANAETRLEAGGWTVTSIGTMTNDIVSTCAYYDPSVSGAKAAAKALRAQFPWIKRVEPRFPELAAGPVVVVLTWDYQPG